HSEMSTPWRSSRAAALPRAAALWFVAVCLAAALSLAAAAAHAGPDEAGSAPQPLRDRPVTRELRRGESHRYSLALAAGEACQVTVDQRGIDVLVDVEGPDGGRLMTIDLVRPQDGAEELYLVAEAAGTYRLEVRPSEVDEAT